MHAQIIMDRHGDTRHEFDPADFATVARAEERFRALTGKGFRAVALGKAGEPDKLLRTFDPTAVETLFIPQLQGGWELLPDMNTLRALLACFQAPETASQKAWRLLAANLTPLQIIQYETLRFFGVIGGETGHRYRINRGDALNVDEYDEAW